METSLTLSMLEIAFFLSGAMVLGITIRLFVTNRSSGKTTTGKKVMHDPANNEWKQKYTNDINKRDNEISALREQILKSGENIRTLSTELNELRQQHKGFEAVKEQLEKKIWDLNKKNNLHRIVMPEKKGIVARG